MHHLTVAVTERQVFKRCRRMWNYGSFNRLGLTKIVGKKSLSIGTLIHLSLASWIENPNDNLYDIFMKHSVAELNKVKEAYKQQIGAAISEDELAPFIDSVDLGRDMMKNYQEFWKSPLPEGFTLVAPEQKVTVEVNEHFSLEGKFDGLIKDTRDRIFVLEHKTYGQRPYENVLNSNDQFLAYLWLARKLNIGNVIGIAYDGMWKRAKPARGYTLADLFIRKLLYRTEAEIQNFEKLLIYELTDMAEVYFDPTRIYPNRRWEGCYDCQFDPLCTAESNDEDMEYIQKAFYMKRPRDEGEEE